MRRNVSVLLAMALVTSCTLFCALTSCAEKGKAGKKGVAYQFNLSYFVGPGRAGSERTIADLSKHGDLAFGTFADMDGEITGLNGKFYRSTRKGTVRVDEDAPIIFAIATFFEPEMTFNARGDLSPEEINAVILDNLPTRNIYYAVKIRALFTSVRVKTIDTDTVPGTGTMDMKTFKDVHGTLVGFYVPPFMRQLTPVFWGDCHLHFISDDGTIGGHAANYTARSPKIELQGLPEFVLDLPVENETFRKTSLPEILRGARRRQFPSKRGEGGFPLKRETGQ